MARDEAIPCVLEDERDQSLLNGSLLISIVDSSGSGIFLTISVFWYVRSNVLCDLQRKSGPQQVLLGLIRISPYFSGP